METLLLNPPQKYINYVENSLHYMNCPKHMYNEDLHTVGRLQGFEPLVNFLKWAGCTTPIKTANYVLENIVKIKYPEFAKLNTNSYINKDIKDLNANCRLTHKKFEIEFAKYWDDHNKTFRLGKYSMR
jgi:hypothetical protein